LNFLILTKKLVQTQKHSAYSMFTNKRYRSKHTHCSYAFISFISVLDSDFLAFTKTLSYTVLFELFLYLSSFIAIKESMFISRYKHTHAFLVYIKKEKKDIILCIKSVAF